MKKIIMILLTTLLYMGCCKDDAPEYKPSADFKMYYACEAWYTDYWENVDRDTFGWGYITFEARDTTPGLSYEWKIGLETITGKRAVARDFSNVAHNTRIPITLMVHYPNKKSDTITRSFVVYIDTNMSIKKRANWLFVNDQDPKDTLRIRYFKGNSTFGISDTLFVNDCKKYIESTHFLYTYFEMGFSVAGDGNWMPCNFNKSIVNSFIKLDNRDKNKAYMRAEMAVNGKWVLFNYTGFQQH